MNTPTKPTFHAHGKDWFPHTPGDPMPCEPDEVISVLTYEGEDEPRRESNSQPASFWWWSDGMARIVGWRYADPQPESAESVTDELARLREENANMRTVIKDAYNTIAGHSHYINLKNQFESDDLYLTAALAKLAPFTQP